MQSEYPTTPLVLVDGTEPEIVAAVKAGTCAGGVSTDVHLKHFLSESSENACDVELTGSTLNFGYYAIPWKVQAQETVSGP
jgi:hypothetical protein